ncbi:unnamed protein product [Effrenium voratum]|nr:unnamed protein product [Effrenium voratum]
MRAGKMEDAEGGGANGARTERRVHVDEEKECFSPSPRHLALGTPRADILRLTGMDEPEESEELRLRHFLTVRGPPIFLVAVLLPICMRTFGLEPQARCALIMVGVLTLSLFEVMPLFCVALFIPVMGSICAVFGDARTMMTTSTLLLRSFFNQTSFLVLGSLVINAIFAKCGALDALTALLLRRWRLESKTFLLVIMLCTMAACSVLCSGSIVVLAALKPLLAPRGLDVEVPVVKRLLLGVAFGANAGSVLLPISSTTTLITISLLRDFDHKLTLWSWIFMSGPVAVLSTVASWWTLIKLFPAREDDGEEVLQSIQKGLRDTARPQLSRQVSLAHAEEAETQMSEGHWFMLVATCVAVVAMTVFAEALEPVLGHPAILALAVVVLAFGSGFLSRDEFLTLEWDLLAIVGGTNVMALMVRETALAAHGSVVMTQSGLFDHMAFWPFMVLVISVLLIFGTFTGHALCAVIMLPLLVPLGVKLQEAEFFALLCCIVIPFGMGMPNASFDNMAAQSLSRSLKRRSELSVRDYFGAGSLMALAGGSLTLTLGFGIGFLQHGMPKGPAEVRRRTPEELEPKVVKENRVLDFMQRPSFVRELGEALREKGGERVAEFNVGALRESDNSDIVLGTGEDEAEGGLPEDEEEQRDLDADNRVDVALQKLENETSPEDELDTETTVEPAPSTSESTAASTSESTEPSTSESTAASTSESTTAASTSESTEPSTSESTAASTSESTAPSTPAPTTESLTTASPTTESSTTASSTEATVPLTESVISSPPMTAKSSSASDSFEFFGDIHLPTAELPGLGNTDGLASFDFFGPKAPKPKGKTLAPKGIDMVTEKAIEALEGEAPKEPIRDSEAATFSQAAVSSAVAEKLAREAQKKAMEEAAKAREEEATARAAQLAAEEAFRKAQRAKELEEQVERDLRKAEAAADMAVKNASTAQLVEQEEIRRLDEDVSRS